MVEKAEKTTVVQIRDASFWTKYLIGHLYLIQGFFYGFFRSVPLAYQRVPNYKILSLFDMASLPFSFKFLMAPFEERFTSHKYGKRKTWIVINLIICSLMLFLLSFVVGVEGQYEIAAALLFMCILATAFKDVSSDALAVQQIPHTPTISIATFSGEQIGKAITLSVFLALISRNYWTDYGYSERIMNPSTFMRIIVVFILISAILIHFLFNEKENQITPVDEEEEELQRLSMWEIVKHYKHFIMPKFKLFRQGLIILLMNHGILYFVSTYPIELMKHGLERQTLMFIENLCFIPNILGSYILSRFINHLNLSRYVRIFTAIQFGYVLFLYLTDFKGKSIIVVLFTLFKIINSAHYYLQTCTINQISKGRFSGITITVMLSISNFSRNAAIHKEMIHLFGYDSCVKAGLVYAALVVLLLPIASKWVVRGNNLLHLKEN